MIDLEKAFDLVWHNGLLHNMKQVGLPDIVFNFVEDFLKDCSIQVRVGAAMFSTYFLECNASGQCTEPTTVHHHDQRIARIVKRCQARTIHELQFDMEIWSEPVSLVQRHPAVPSGDDKILRRMEFQDLDQQASRNPLLSKQTHPDGRNHPKDQRRLKFLVVIFSRASHGQ